MKRLAAMGAIRISWYLKEEGITQFFADFPRVLSSDITKEELEQLEGAYFQQLCQETNSWKILVQLLEPMTEAGHLAWTAFELSVLYYMEERIKDVFVQIDGNAGSGPNLSLAAKLIYGSSAELEHPILIREAYAKCELLLQAQYPARRIGAAALHVDDRLVQWMEEPSAPYEHPLLIHNRRPLRSVALDIWNKQREALYESLSDNENPMAIGVVQGMKESGRSYLIRQVAARMSCPVLFIPMSYFGSLEQSISRWRILLRELLLGEILLCVCDVTAELENMHRIDMLVREYDLVQPAAGRRKYPLLFTVSEEVKLIPRFDQLIRQIRLPALTLEQSKAAWDYFASCYLPGVEIAAENLAVKMKLPIGMIEKVLSNIAGRHQGEIDEREISRVCYEILDDGRYDNVKRIETRYTLDDLKMEESQKQIILDICSQVTYRKRVLNDWKLSKRYAYGTSVSALFAGPPGTGKTMAVHVMAGILGLELYKVDLSQIVDKYIGETEKRLNEVFERAEKSNMILFFDEADAIIGKRSETTDAKDKYANTEVAFLLQRMEEYDGIVILATNYSQNIDAAFMRRIRFSVHFTMPDEETRKQIWRSAFAEETPMGAIDFDYLASQFEFSGAQIKNVVWNACFFAAENSKQVEMEHIVRAIQLELTKDKKVAFTEGLGKYAHLIY